MRRSGKVYAATMLTVCAAIAFRGPVGASSSTASVDPDNAFLDAMMGDWSMDGPTLGKATHYALHGERILVGGFVRLQMRDKANPPQYQADFFLGYDRSRHDYIGHWLDQFGAAGARVVAEGHRDGNTLVLLFPYAEGALRDTFTYDPAKLSWTWLLESQEKNGSWSTFASYDVTKS